MAPSGVKRALLIVACGCQQGGPQQQPSPPPPPGPVPVRVVLEDAAGVPPDAELPDVLKQLAADEAPSRICFAVSANHRRVACVEQVDDWENTLTGARGVKILGDLGDARSEWSYFDAEANPHIAWGEVTKAIDRSVIDDVRHSLATRRYQPFAATELPLITSAIVNGKTIRRHRVITVPAAVYDPRSTELGGGSWNTYDDRLEVECDDRTVAIPLDAGLDLRYGELDEVLMYVSSFNDRMLLELDGHWGIEGEHGTTRGAQLIDLVALCAR
jgi:hypothetical protein